LRNQARGDGVCAELSEGDGVTSFAGCDRDAQRHRGVADGRAGRVSDWGLLLGAVIPFTLLVIFPTNKRLLDPSLDKDSARASDLLRRWGKLHAVRSCLSLASFLVLAAARSL
jgi:hypothetical protein